MKFVFLASREKGVMEPIKTSIPGEYRILEGSFNDSSLKILKSLSPCVVVASGEEAGCKSWAEKAGKYNSFLTFLELGNKVSPGGIFYDVIPSPFSAEQVKMALERAWERSALMVKINALKNRGDTEENNYCDGSNFFSRARSRGKEKVLWDFTRALGNNFNKERLLSLFLDTVKELAPVTAFSLLLPGKNNNYYIYFQKGLNPDFCSQFSFDPSQGLLAYLAEEGHIVRLDNNNQPFPRWEQFVEVLQEMQLLQGVVFIPLMAYGKLAGVLSLGHKITGAPFFEDELEMLYSLAENVALALRDIELHHQLCYQKEYIEKILSYMTSGLISIDNENRVVNFNTRAGEILGLDGVGIVGKDLRVLPSPLGDLLFETREKENYYYKKEVTLNWKNIPLDVSTYPLLQEEREKPAGSVMIIDDISERKQLEAQKQQAAQLEILNKFVGQLAHEVKNPMVAIQTFCELLPEKHHDESFREFFSSTVAREVKRLNELVEKLVAFASDLSYESQVVDINDILEESYSLLRSQGKLDDSVNLERYYARDKLFVKGDKTLLSRAFSYLMISSFQSLEEGGAVNVETRFEPDSFSEGAAGVVMWDSKTTTVEKDPDKLFDPLYTCKDSYISLGLPVSRKIIEEHGGTIKATAGADKSLIFTILLPAYNQEGDE